MHRSIHQEVEKKSHQSSKSKVVLTLLWYSPALLKSVALCYGRATTAGLNKSQAFFPALPARSRPVGPRQIAPDLKRRFVRGVLLFIGARFASTNHAHAAVIIVRKSEELLGAFFYFNLFVMREYREGREKSWRLLVGVSVFSSFDSPDKNASAIWRVFWWWV